MMAMIAMTRAASVSTMLTRISRHEAVQEADHEVAHERGEEEREQALLLEEALLGQDEEHGEADLEEHQQRQDHSGVAPREEPPAGEVGDGAERGGQEQRHHHHQLDEGDDRHDERHDDEHDRGDESEKPLGPSVHTLGDDEAGAHEQHGVEDDAVDQGEVGERPPGWLVHLAGGADHLDLVLVVLGDLAPQRGAGTVPAHDEGAAELDQHGEGHEDHGDDEEGRAQGRHSATSRAAQVVSGPPGQDTHDPGAAVADRDLHLLVGPDVVLDLEVAVRCRGLDADRRQRSDPEQAEVALDAHDDDAAADDVEQIRVVVIIEAARGDLLALDRARVTGHVTEPVDEVVLVGRRALDLRPAHDQRARRTARRRPPARRRRP